MDRWRICSEDWVELVKIWKRKEVRKVANGIQLEKSKKQKMPFILMFFEEYKGARAATTSGCWGDIDASDIF